MMKTARTPRRFFIFIIGLATLGFFVFSSASLGLLSRSGPSFGNIALKQLVVLLFGLVLALALSRVSYKFWRRAALPLFLLGLVLTLLVFSSKWGIHSGGARRWLELGSFTFQPAEFLKLAFVLYLAAILTKAERSNSLFERLLPFLFLFGSVGIILVAQPDIDTLALIIGSGLGMLFVSGLPWRYLGLILGLVLLSALIVSFTKPYLIERVKTFLNPDLDVQGSSYQINQSLIAIGSGGIFGRGFGQSIHKFKLLPEPIGDSVFAVAGEEFGFAGATLIVLAFLIFALWGLKISLRSPDRFARLLVLGLVIMITAGAFTNIASMLGLMPLAGTTLPFFSQGGSSLLAALVAVGIILNVARYQHHLTVKS